MACARAATGGPMAVVAAGLHRPGGRRRGLGHRWCLKQTLARTVARV
jgi:hypothetical protein